MEFIDVYGVQAMTCIRRQKERCRMFDRMIANMAGSIVDHIQNDTSTGSVQY
jgi:hypothetical protein